jgi:uncharacterized protein YbjQ (UPF0145 family)
MGGLPAAAAQRLERQRASGATGSLLSAPAAASVLSAGLAPAGEVFGCLVMNLGWAGGGCDWWSNNMGGFGGMGGFGAMGGWFSSPVTTSGHGGWRGFAPYVEAFETAWHGAVDRMRAEARALGAHGVVGVRIERSRIDGAAWEFTALGTAVRSTDPARVPFPASEGDVWCTNLSAEDTASAILSGYLPREIVLGMSVSTKHEDSELRQQRSIWSGNVEISGMTELIRAARNESRSRLVAQATHVGGAELVVTDMDLSEFETQCGGQDGVDLHAESIIVGTTLVPIPGAQRRPDSGRVLTILPLRDSEGGDRL